MEKDIDIKTVEYIAYELRVQHKSIPEFNTRYSGILESCLATPFQKFNNQYLYKGLYKKASVLFYGMIKNHPFQNGNKRIAVTTLLLFLYLNNKWIKVDNKELYNFAIWVAQSPASLKNTVIDSIHEFIKINLVRLN